MIYVKKIHVYIVYFQRHFILLLGTHYDHSDSVNRFVIIDLISNMNL